MKAIKTLVIGMGVLIVVGLGVLVWGMMRANSQMDRRQPQIPDMARVAPPVDGTENLRRAPYMADVVLPPGAKIERMETAGNLLVLQVSGAEGRIIVIDPRSGQVVGTVRPVSEGR